MSPGEPEADRQHRPRLTAIAEAHLGQGGEGLEDAIDPLGAGQAGDGRCVRQLHHAQLAERIGAANVSHVDAGHREVQGGLLLWGEAEVGEEEGRRIDPVALLLRTVDVDCLDEDALLAQQALVALEGHTSGLVALGIAGELLAEHAQRDRRAGGQQDQDQVGEPLELLIGVRHLVEDRS